MSLLEALLLDPVRINVWIANRADGVSGSGTQNDPFDGSTATKFDAAMSLLLPNTLVHLGPGTFQTSGYADGVSGGWQPQVGMKIVGSGIDITTLQLLPSGTNAHFYAVGHALSAGPIDFFELSDLTIDSNLAAFTGATPACGAVRVMGNHALIKRVKVINWGTKASSRPCFVASVITADPSAGRVEDCGIQECIAITPSTPNVGPVTIFHAGGVETTAQTVAPLPSGLGIAPYIRNCFADGGQVTPGPPEIHGMSMSWCKAGIIEGNQAHNMMYGVFQQPTGAQDVVLRNNWFKNVNKGAILGAEIDTGSSGSLTLSAPVATVTVSPSFPSSNTFQPGEFALLSSSSSAYNGLVVQIVSASSTGFTFDTSITTPTSAAITDVQKVTGVTNLIIEGNVTELPQVTTGDIIGIHLKDWWTNSVATQDPRYPAYIFSTVVIRDNKVRYVDGQLLPSYTGYPMQINGAMDLLVRNNVVQSPNPTQTPPLQNARCGAVAYFNNQQPTGILFQGWSDDNKTNYEELSTITDFALVMSLFNRK